MLDPVRGRFGWMILLASALTLPLAAPAATADHGPLPSAQPALEAAARVQANVDESAALLAGFAEYGSGQAQDAAEEVVRVLVDEHAVVIPFSQLNNIIARAGTDGAALVRLTGDSGSAAIVAAGAEGQAAIASYRLTARALQNKLGLFVSAGSPSPVSVAAPTPCTRDVQAALDAAEPGATVLACAGNYAGPLVVRQHFVTLRGEQGAQATLIDGHGGPGVVVEAVGVTVGGFTIQGATGSGAAGVVVGGPTHEGQVLATLLEENVLRRNAVGVLVWRAPATFILGNTIRDSVTSGQPGGVGVLVVEGPDASGLPPEILGVGGGAIAAGNNFLNNARHAVRSLAPPSGTPGLPTVAAFNYYGQVTGANVEVLGSCVGAASPQGDPRCRNGVGAGVVYAGFSPVPL